MIHAEQQSFIGCEVFEEKALPIKEKSKLSNIDNVNLIVFKLMFGFLEKISTPSVDIFFFEMIFMCCLNSGILFRVNDNFSNTSNISFFATFTFIL